ncbi:MAG: VWA domain-containing protein, partial [Planctomycetaceae bacterium]
ETQEILAAKLTDEQLLHKKIAALEIKLKDWGRIANSLVALRGPLKKVVFLYDTSGSMSKGDRFEPSRKLLQQWISNLQMESFAVIDFDNEAVCWMTSFQLATDASRAAANKFLAGTVAGGNTRTDLAIETAFRNFPDVDTIVLLTDGRMTDEKGLEVSDDRLALLRDQLKAQHAGVVINTIGIGDYYTASADNKDGGTNKSLGHFLQMIAVEHNGVFIGLGERSSGAKQ